MSQSRQLADILRMQRLTGRTTPSLGNSRDMPQPQASRRTVISNVPNERIRVNHGLDMSRPSILYARIYHPFATLQRCHHRYLIKHQACLTSPGGLLCIDAEHPPLQRAPQRGLSCSSAARNPATRTSVSTRRSVEDLSKAVGAVEWM